MWQVPTRMSRCSKSPASARYRSDKWPTSSRATLPVRSSTQTATSLSSRVASWAWKKRTRTRWRSRGVRANSRSSRFSPPLSSTWRRRLWWGRAPAWSWRVSWIRTVSRGPRSSGSGTDSCWSRARESAWRRATGRRRASVGLWSRARSASWTRAFMCARRLFRVAASILTTFARPWPMWR